MTLAWRLEQAIQSVIAQIHGQRSVRLRRRGGFINGSKLELIGECIRNVITLNFILASSAIPA
ncbi:MAG: hypothetical protein B9S32_07435 [Verrucomicrobia bacterium Tous-C9LFEB]|nr:MAG: hypothetical protein B9S32_07435 [Verrucomicrobia bacterium Tous-C9LFEB]